jgi:hypothetical protein
MNSTSILLICLALFAAAGGMIGLNAAFRNERDRDVARAKSDRIAAAWLLGLSLVLTNAALT